MIRWESPGNSQGEIRSYQVTVHKILIHGEVVKQVKCGCIAECFYDRKSMYCKDGIPRDYFRQDITVSAKQQNRHNREAVEHGEMAILGAHVE